MFEKTKNPSHHASAARKGKQEIQKEYENLNQLDYLHDFFMAMPQIIMVVNKERQLVYSNGALLEHLGIDSISELLGKRPGESFGCINAENLTGGCGTSRNCRYCGVVGTLQKSQHSQKKEIGECRVISWNEQNGSVYYDLEVTAAPFKMESHHFTILTLTDISSDKRKKNLEQTFFHDILNVAGSLSGVMEILPDLDEERRQDFIYMATSLSQQVVDEIKTHRTLLQAEQGALSLQKDALQSRSLISKVIQHMSYHNVAKNKKIALSENTIKCSFTSDEVVLTRILVNLLKNALEATEEHGIVELGCRLTREERLRFWVRNDGVMSEEVQAQVFQRYYSTKGQGRGIGTYSVKLLGEHYLGGKVGFESNEEQGTLFYIDLNVY